MILWFYDPVIYDLRNCRSFKECVEHFINALDNEFELCKWLNDEYGNLKLMYRLKDVGKIVKRIVEDHIDGYVSLPFYFTTLNIAYFNFGLYSKCIIYAVDKGCRRYIYSPVFGFCKKRLLEVFGKISPFEKLTREGMFRKIMFRKDCRNGIKFIRVLYVPLVNKFENVGNKIRQWLIALFIMNNLNRYYTDRAEITEIAKYLYNLFSSCRDVLDVVFTSLYILNKWAKIHPDLYDTKELVLRKIVEVYDDFVVVKEKSYNRSYYLVIFNKDGKQWKFHIPCEKAGTSKFREKVVEVREVEYVVGTSPLDLSKLPSVSLSISKVLNLFIRDGLVNEILNIKEEILQSLREIIEETQLIKELKEIINFDKMIEKYLKRYKNGRKILQMISS